MVFGRLTHLLVNVPCLGVEHELNLLLPSSLGGEKPGGAGPPRQLQRVGQDTRLELDGKAAAEASVRLSQYQRFIARSRQRRVALRHEIAKISKGFDMGGEEGQGRKRLPNLDSQVRLELKSGLPVRVDSRDAPPLRPFIRRGDLRLADGKARRDFPGKGLTALRV